MKKARFIAVALVFVGTAAARFPASGTGDSLYQETYRPQFHFSPLKNWTNDPNGLVFYDGVYHLFFQHNPFGTEWGNMTWGHAVSRDLVHWTERAPAIRPDALGTIFSGSAVVDSANTAGFQTGEEKVLVCIYTSAGGTSPESQGRPFTQSLAYSNDRGATWTKYEKNPVLGHVAGSNRDPKVIWHGPSQKWVMALFLDGNAYALFGSKNLKEWTKLCDVAMPGTSECPDFFPLPVDGDPAHLLWVFWGANGNYRLGTFDGTAFTPNTEVRPSLWGANDYAAQTYSGIPESDGRRIQISWMNGGRYPGMPFNQQMSFPRELTLRTTPAGARLRLAPVREIESLRGATKTWTDVALKGDAPALHLGDGELWDVEAVIEPGSAPSVGLRVRGEEIVYDNRTKTLTCLGKAAPLEPEDGRISLRVLVDRTSIEIFTGGGLVTMCSCFLPDLRDRTLSAFARGGDARIASLTLHELKSAWTVAAAGQSPWDRAAMEGLFPRAPAGWTVAEMNVEELKTLDQLASEPFDTWTEMFGGKAPDRPRVRYRLTREYRNGARTIVMTVDSEDIPTAFVLLAAHGYDGFKGGRLVPLPADKKTPPEKLAAEGMTLAFPSDHLGVLFVKGPESELSVLLGEHGLLALNGKSAGSLRDMEILMKALDLRRLDEFARFDHHKKDRDSRNP